MNKPLSYLHNKPSKSAIEHSNKCHTQHLDDRVNCSNCAGYTEQNETRTRLDSITRTLAGYESMNVGRCRWIHGAMHPDRLHRCDSFSPKVTSDSRREALKQAARGEVKR